MGNNTSKITLCIGGRGDCLKNSGKFQKIYSVYAIEYVLIKKIQYIRKSLI